MRTRSAGCRQDSIYISWKSESKILIESTLSTLPFGKCFAHISLYLSMFSQNSAHCGEEEQEGRTAESMCCVMVGHDTKSKKDRVLRGATAMTVYLSELEKISEKKYRKQLSDPVCVCGF